MKKILLLLCASFAFLSCSVDNEEVTEKEAKIETVDATYDATAACGSDIFVEVCSNAINNPTVRGFKNFFDAQIYLYSPLPLNGTYSPSMETLLEQYRQGATSLATNYTVTTPDCGEVTIEIAGQIIQSRQAEAGQIANLSVCTGQPGIDLNTLLSNDAVTGGVFTSAQGGLTGSTFNPSIGPGVYNITYTVNNRVKCVEGSDSTSFDITVTKGYRANNINKTLCKSEINRPTISGFRTYFKNLIYLNTDLPTNGTWNPSIETLLNQYNQSGGVGTFNTTYTVNTDCGVYSLDVTVQVNNCNS